jgi:hypothetical protein
MEVGKLGWGFEVLEVLGSRGASSVGFIELGYHAGRLEWLVNRIGP